MDHQGLTPWILISWMDSKKGGDEEGEGSWDIPTATKKSLTSHAANVFFLFLLLNPFFSQRAAKDFSFPPYFCLAALSGPWRESHVVICIHCFTSF